MNILSRAFSGFKAAVASAMKPVFSSIRIFSTGHFREFAKRDFYYGVVFSCIDAIATNVASQDFMLYKVQGDNKADQPDHPALKLLQRPNSFQTGVDLIYLLSSHIDAFGVAYLYPVSNPSGEPVELWVLDANRMYPLRGQNFIEGYVYYNPLGQRIDFQVGEIIEIKRPHPFDQHLGISTIEMAKFAVEGDYSAQIWNNNFFQNGALPSGTLETENTLDDETFKRVREQWHNEYEGRDNAYKTLILEGGLKYNSITLRQKDMDFMEQRKFNRDEILSIFKVPKPILAISDDVNRANAQTAEYVFAKRTVKPRLDLIYEKLNQFYLPRFKNTQGVLLEYENPVPDDETSQLAEKQASVNIWKTVNEVRSEEGLDPVPGGEKLYIASTNVPITDSGMDMEPPNTPPKSFRHVKDVRDRRFISKKHRYLTQKEKGYIKELSEYFGSVVADIRDNEIPEGKKAAKFSIKGLEDVVDELIPDITKKRGYLVQILFSNNRDALQEGASNVADIYDLPDNFSLEHSGALAYLNERSANTADSITSSILDRARQIVADQLSQNVTDLQTIKDQILETLDDESEYRAERIARTELVSAYAEGTMENMKSSGVVEQVKWIVSNPPDEACQMNADQVVNLGDSFPSGDTQPPVHPNCECDVVPYFED